MLDGLPVKPWLTTTPVGPPSTENGSASGSSATASLLQADGNWGAPSFCLPDLTSGDSEARGWYRKETSTKVREGERRISPYRRCGGGRGVFGRPSSLSRPPPPGF